jgi:hypothetical protein
MLKHELTTWGSTEIEAKNKENRKQAQCSFAGMGAPSPQASDRHPPNPFNPFPPDRTQSTIHTTSGNHYGSRVPIDRVWRPIVANSPEFKPIAASWQLSSGHPHKFSAPPPYADQTPRPEF